jgi:hypothetical protein
LNEPTDSKDLPNDEELAEMLARAEGRKPGKGKRDPNKPGPRMPEALYYYLFILFEGAILAGVWGFMRMGVGEALKGPGIEAPILDQALYQLQSIWVGFVDVVLTQPWIPLGCAAVAAAVFMPKTPKARKRMATLVSSLLVCVFLVLIALQFSEDITNAGAGSPF